MQKPGMGLLATFVLVLAMGAAPSFGASTVGSFEIEGNLVDDSGSGEPIDWLSSPFPANKVDFTDTVGRGDDVFGQGSKELEPGGWKCVTSSAPGKDDIKDGSVAIRNFGGKQFMYVKFRRAAVNGDAHIDYEFNKSTASNPSCPALPARSAGDVVLTFDTENGGKTIIVRAFQWQGDALSGTFLEQPLGPKGGLWDAAVNIPNTIPGEKDGSFGEAALNLTDTIGAIECGEFAKVYMKSRAATSINAELKDRTVTRQAPGACPKPTLTKSADKTAIEPGQTVTYTLAYGNTGDAEAKNVVISDTIPAGTEFVSCTGGCTVTGGQAVWQIGTVPVGGTGTVTMTVRVLATAGCQICNVATIATTGVAPVSSNTVCITNTPGSDPAGATARGSAFGAFVQSVFPAIGPTTISPVSSEQNGVGSASQDDEELNVNAPADGSVLHADVLRTQSTSTVTASPGEAKNTSVAEAVNVNVLNGLVTASFVRGVATTTASGTDSGYSSAGSTFKDLVVDGTARNNVAPGTVIGLNSLLFGEGSYVKLYERIGSTSRPANTQLSGGIYAADLTVNMINVHVTDSNALLPGNQTVDVIVSNARAHSDFPQTTLCAARADQSVSGDALIASAMADPLLVPITFGAVSIPPTGGTEKADLDTLGVGETVNASTTRSFTTGSLGNTSRASSHAHAEQVCVLRSPAGVCTVGATLVQSQSNSEAGKTANSVRSDSAGTELVGLTVNGTSQSANPPPNTTIPLPGLGYLVLNEQFCDGSVDFSTTPSCSDGTGHTGLTVRAIHVVVTAPANPLALTGAEVIVAEAHSDATYR